MQSLSIVDWKWWVETVRKYCRLLKSAGKFNLEAACARACLLIGQFNQKSTGSLCLFWFFAGWVRVSTKKTSCDVFIGFIDHTISTSFQSLLARWVCCRRENSLHSQYGTLHFGSIWNLNLVWNPNKGGRRFLNTWGEPWFLFRTSSFPKEGLETRLIPYLQSVHAANQFEGDSH